MTSSSQELRVLVVDPSATSRSLCRKLLADAGYSVLEVPSGRDALALLGAPQAGRVDAVLKAHDPHASNAPRFLQKLKDSGLGKDLPVIVYSSEGAEDVVLRCMSLGAADFWIKPLRSNEVRTLWTRVWTRRGGASAAAAVHPSALGESSGDGDGSDDTRNATTEEKTSNGGSAPEGTHVAAPSQPTSGPEGTGTATGTGGGTGRGSNDANGSGGGGSGGEPGGTAPDDPAPWPRSQHLQQPQQAAAAVLPPQSGAAAAPSPSPPQYRHHHHHHHRHHHLALGGAAAAGKGTEASAAQGEESAAAAMPKPPAPSPARQQGGGEFAAPPPRPKPGANGWSSSVGRGGNGNASGATSKAAKARGGGGDPAKVSANEVAEVAEALASLRGACEAEAAARPGAPPPPAAAGPRARGARSADTQVGVVRGPGDSGGTPPSGPPTMMSPENLQASAAAAAAAAAAAHMPRPPLPPMFAAQAMPMGMPPGFDPGMYGPYGAFFPPPLPFPWPPPGPMAEGAPPPPPPHMMAPFPYGAPPQGPAPPSAGPSLQQELPPLARGGKEEPGTAPPGAHQAQHAPPGHPQQYPPPPWMQHGYYMAAMAAAQHAQHAQHAQAHAHAQAQAQAQQPGFRGAMWRGPPAWAPASSAPRPPASSAPVSATTGGPLSGGAPAAPSRADIRQAAVQKYREKRKARDGSAASKIRYQSRKVLAEARPRVRGQFVKVHRGRGEAEDSSDARLAGAAAATADDGSGGSAGTEAMDREDAGPAAGGAEEAMEYDAQEEDLGDEEPSACAPAEAEISGGLAGAMVEPAPTADGPPAGRRLTRSQITHVQARASPPAPQISGHKHRRGASTPAVTAPSAPGGSKSRQTKANGGSDSGSNSLQEEGSPSDDPLLQAPPSKQQHR